MRSASSAYATSRCQRPLPRRSRGRISKLSQRQEPKVRRPFAGERWIRTVGPRLSSATSFWPEFHSEFPNPATAFRTVPATPSVVPLRRRMMSAQSPSAHVALVADLRTSCLDSQVRSIEIAIVIMKRKTRFVCCGSDARIGDAPLVKRVRRAFLHR